MTRPSQAPPAAGDPAPRTVLFVAYHYPPMRSPGVERSAKFSRYLPEFGYRPRVVSTGAFGSPKDGVIRAWEPLGLYRRLFNPAARRKGPRGHPRPHPGSAGRPLGPGPAPAAGPRRPDHLGPGGRPRVPSAGSGGTGRT